MLKGFFIGFIACSIIMGLLWFFIGRANIADIRGTTDRFDGDLQRVERAIDEFGTDFNRYTGKVSVTFGESEQLRDQIGDLREEFSGYAPEVGIIKSELITISDGINDVEKFVRRSNQINRDFANVLYNYRRRSKASREEE